jgi:hypothetical protein
MSTINEMLTRFEQVNLVELTADAMEQQPNVSVELNRDQMLEGKRSNNEQIGEYRPLSVFERSRIGRQTSYVDLYLTGEFQSRMYQKINGDDFDLDSSDTKRDKLVFQYKDNIFGLTSESKRIAWIEYTPYVVQGIKNITGTQ